MPAARGCAAAAAPCVLSTPYGNATEMFFEQVCQYARALALYVLIPPLQRIDHFSWAAPPDGATTYQQRFFVSFDNWRNDSTGCVFFYLGNEADVSLCVQYEPHPMTALVTPCACTCSTQV